MSTVLQARQLSSSVWTNSNGIGDLELFPNFLMSWTGPRMNRLSRPVAVTIPENLLVAVGFAAKPPEISAEEANFINRTPLLEQHERNNGSGDRIIYADELSEEAFLGHQVKVTRPSYTTGGINYKYRKIYGYVVNSVNATREDPNSLGKFIKHFGWDLGMVATGVVLTVQRAVEGNG